MKSRHSLAAALLVFLLSAPVRLAFAQAGSVDLTFNASIGAQISQPKVYNPALQPDGKIIVSQAGVSAAIRLNPDGSADPAFAVAPSGVSSAVLLCTAILPNGKVLIGGGFSNPQSVCLRRFNADGAPDPAFDAKLTIGTADDPSVACLAILNDGGILVGGGFTIAGTNRTNLARLLTDGTLDTSYDPQVNGFVSSVAVQPDGKTVIGGAFTSVRGTPRNHVARLNPDGSLDSTFDPGLSGYVYTVALQADGKILVGGSQMTIGSGLLTALIRLNADGTPDTGFAPANLYFDQARSIAVQANGEILAMSYDQVTRFDANGNDLGSFASIASNRDYQSLCLQADGKIVLGGSFTSIQSVSRNYLARLDNEVATQALSVPTAGKIRWQRGGASPETQAVGFELSTDGGGTWTSLGLAARIAGGWELGGLNLPPAGAIRARAGTSSGSGNGSSSLLETVHPYILPAPPTVTTLSPALQAATSAQLAATVNPDGAPGTMHFAYSADPALAGATVTPDLPFAAGTADLPFLQSIDGLAPASVYYCRAIATSARGTTPGEIVPFTTPGVPGDLWRYQHFGASWAGVSFAEDDDGDGATNLAEYAFGGDPLAPDAAAVLPRIDTTGGHLRITFKRDPTHTDIQAITVQGSNDFKVWTDLAQSNNANPTVALVAGVIVGESAQGALQQVQVTDSVPIATQPVRVLRVKLTQ